MRIFTWLQSYFNNWDDWRCVYGDGQRTRRLRRDVAYDMKEYYTDSHVIFDPMRQGGHDEDKL